MHNIILLKQSFFAVGCIAVICGVLMNAQINSMNNNLDVEFDNIRIDGVYINDAVIDKNNLSFATSELKNFNDTSILEYDLVNKSTNYDANIDIECYKVGSKGDYFSIEDITPKVIEAGKKDTGSIKVTLTKEVSSDVNEKFYCKMDVSFIPNTR